MIRFAPLNSVLTFVAVGVAVVSTLTLLKGRRRVTRGSRLPPGPVPLPLLGNPLSIDAKKPWTTYAKWATRYGDIFMIRVLKQEIIVVNSEKIAKDLLERRSGIYSDRPYLATREPFGWTFNFGWTPAEAVLPYRPIQLRTARQLISDILSGPHDYSAHIQRKVSLSQASVYSNEENTFRFSAAVIMSIVYDYEVVPGHDHLVGLFERGNALAMESLTPETASIIEASPFVLSLPEWFPSAVIKRKAVVSKYCAAQMIAEPFERYKTRVRTHLKQDTGGGGPAMALDLLRGIKDDDPLRLQLLNETCATAFVAGAETTTSTLLCFMLAMVQHPEVQERAQAEIDAVVGADRLPNLDDRLNLPYVEATLMETFRMYAAVPLGLPHATTADDIYEDIFIPKGFTVVANIWAMYHNKDVYPDPNVFRPGDSMKTTPLTALLLALGVSILRTFKITKALDKRGEEVDFEPSFSYGVTTAPDPFPCSITPRLSNIDIHKFSTEEF